jgi:hypothetical protein
MKTIKHLIIAFTLSPTLFFAQNNEEMIHMDQEHQSEIFLEQNLGDFNAKYHSVFIASYKGFDETKVDFQKGVNESISEEKSSKRFNVTFTSNNDELIAIALQKEIVNRIITISPKGFVKSNERIDAKEVITISFDPKSADKATFQPTTKVILDYDSLTIQVIVIEPSKK